MTGLHLFTSAPCSKSTLTNAGSPLKTAKSRGEALSTSGAGGKMSTLAPLFNKRFTKFMFPIRKSVNIVG